MSSGLCVPFSFLCPSTTSVDLETVWMHAKREPMQFQGVSEETEVFMEVAWKFDFLFARTWSFWSSASELALLVQLVFKIFTILAQSNSFFAVPNLLVLWHALQQVPVGIRTVLAFYVITSSLHVCMKLPFFFADITFDSFFLWSVFLCIFRLHLWLCSVDKSPHYVKDVLCLWIHIVRNVAFSLHYRVRLGIAFFFCL